MLRVMTGAAYDLPPEDIHATLAPSVVLDVGLMGKFWVGDLRVSAQPHGVSGGWIKRNLDGKNKGAPATRIW